jgi:hypothetical protein
LHVGQVEIQKTHFFFSLYVFKLLFGRFSCDLTYFLLCTIYPNTLCASNPL